MTMPPCTKRGLYRNGLSIDVEELDWPAQSPDLNPIEHLWDELENQLRARPNRPTSVPDLTNALVAEWKQVPAAMSQHLSLKHISEPTRRTPSSYAVFCLKKKHYSSSTKLHSWHYAFRQITFSCIRQTQIQPDGKARFITPENAFPLQCVKTL